MIDPDDLQSRDERRLGPALIGDQDAPCPDATGEVRHREGASDRTNGTVQGEFTAHQPTRNRPSTIPLGRDHPPAGEGRDRDRQVVDRAFLASIRGRQVDGETTSGPVESRVANRGSDPFGRLPDCRIGKSDDAHRRQPVGREIDLDATGLGGGADEYETAGTLNHDARLVPRRVPGRRPAESPASQRRTRAKPLGSPSA